MAKTPKAPDLVVKKPLLRFAIERILKTIVILWLFMQAIGFLFYTIWHYSSVAFREFMFRDFIDLWDNYGWEIQWELTPEWAQWIWSIPSWKDVWPWAIIAVLLAAYVWGNKGFPSFSFKVPRTYKVKADNPYNSKQGKESSSTATDDEFEFDPSAFENRNK